MKFWKTGVRFPYIYPERIIPSRLPHQSLKISLLKDKGMKLDKIANSGNDENYTPAYAVEPILEFIKPKSHIWCPFDTEQSWYVKLFKEAGHEVIHSHNGVIGGDFFELNLEADYIISNPPYSKKTEVLESLFKRGIPFAMLLGVVGLFESQKRFDLFKNNEFEIMYFNRRVSFFQNFDDEKPNLNPPFSSVYLTHKMLPDKIMFREIKK